MSHEVRKFAADPIRRALSRLADEIDAEMIVLRERAERDGQPRATRERILGTVETLSAITRAMRTVAEPRKAKP
jgi:hypothetical protein